MLQGMAHSRNSLGLSGNYHSRTFTQQSSATERTNPWSQSEEEIRLQAMQRYGLFMAEKLQKEKWAVAELKLAAEWELSFAYEIGFGRTMTILDRLNCIASKRSIDLPALRRALEEEADLKHAEMAAQRAKNDFTILTQMAREMEEANSKRKNNSPASFYDRHRKCVETQPPCCNDSMRPNDFN